MRRWAALSSGNSADTERGVASSAQVRGSPARTPTQLAQESFQYPPPISPNTGSASTVPAAVTADAAFRLAPVEPAGFSLAGPAGSCPGGRPSPTALFALSMALPRLDATCAARHAPCRAPPTQAAPRRGGTGEDAAGAGDSDGGNEGFDDACAPDPGDADGVDGPPAACGPRRPEASGDWIGGWDASWSPPATPPGSPGPESGSGDPRWSSDSDPESEPGPEFRTEAGPAWAGWPARLEWGHWPCASESEARRGPM